MQAYEKHVTLITEVERSFLWKRMKLGELRKKIMQIFTH